MSGAPLFALVDCNNFFVSCERVFDPSLNGKPVVILSSNDGCAVSRSNEAKALGIPMGAPYFKIKELLRQNKGVAYSSNFALYGDMSRRVMSVLERFLPDFEMYSIDEGFARLDKLHGQNPLQYAQGIRARALQWTGIPVTIGIAPTKTLAKVAAKVAKKSVSGVFCLQESSQIDRTLKMMEIEDVWGISKRWGYRFRQQGMGTPYDLRHACPTQVRRSFSVVGERICQELKGVSCLELEQASDKKSILCSRSFGELQTKRAHIEEAMACHLVRACEKLRKQNSAAKMVTVFLQTNRHRLQDTYYSNSAAVTLPAPTQDVMQMLAMAKVGLRAIFRPGLRYQKVGVMLSDLSSTSNAQGDLFVAQDRSDRVTLAETVSSLNARLGNGTVFFGAQGIERPWQVRSALKTPSYTTKWQDLVEVYL